MAEVIRKFTTPANTEVIYDSAVPLGTISKPVHTKAANQAPSINGNNNYIWSPITDLGQTVTFRSRFFMEDFQLQSPTLPVCVFFTYVSIEAAAISANLEVIDVLGTVVQSIPLFTYSIDGNHQSVETFSGEAFLKPCDILCKSVCLTIEATITTTGTLSLPNFSGYYLGEITAHTVIENKKTGFFKRLKNLIFQNKISN